MLNMCWGDVVVKAISDILVSCNILFLMISILLTYDSVDDDKEAQVELKVYIPNPLVQFYHDRKCFFSLDILSESRAREKKDPERTPLNLL